MGGSAWGKLGVDIVSYVLGDVVHDIYQNVKATKIAPDAPAAVWQMDGDAVSVPGGAANVAAQFRFLSRDVTVCTIGSHPAEEFGLRFLSRGVSPHLGYTTKTRYVQNGHILARVDNDPQKSLLAVPVENRIRAAATVIDRIRVDLADRRVTDGVTGDGKRVVAVCSDYALGFWSPKIAIAAVAAFAERGVPVVVDPKPAGVTLEHWQGATVVKLNASEARAFSGLGRYGDDDQTLRECFALTRATTIVTDGAKPPRVMGWAGFNPDAPGWTGYRYGRDFTTDRPLWASGAGDCFAAYIAAAVAGDLGLTPAGVQTAHAAGAAYTRKRYNAAVHPREADEVAGVPGAKVYRNPAELASRISALPEGTKIGYANGCFDLLHAGQIACLEFAKSQCDFLAVFVNSDSSIVSLKGRNPVLWLDERTAALAALGCVDAVIHFNELTPVQAFAAVGRCDVLVKGEEYRGRKVEGREYAGRVEFAPETVRLHAKEIVERAINRGREAVRKGGSDAE